MKKKFYMLLAIIICLPTIILCGCSSPSNLPSINLSTYYSSSATTSLYKETLTGTISLADLAADKPNLDTLAPYVKIELPGNLSWLYKMYIDYITFEVYTNKSLTHEMTVKVSVSNLASEDDRAHPSTFTHDVSFVPEKEKPIECKVKVNKVYANAADSDNDAITFDILNSVSGTVADDNGNLTDFKWTIYNLKIYGESRSYSK